MKGSRLLLAVGAGVAAVLCATSPALAQPPSLGAAQSFAVLGGTTVTAAGTGTVITGDVGVSPGTSITGFPAGATVVPPFSTHSNDSAAIAAQASVTSLYTTLAGTGGATPIVAELGGVTLTPGAYSFSSTANIAAGTTLTLSGGGTYIFQVGSAITANVNSNVVLINGASACNVFWQVTSAATLNGITFAGTVVAQAGVTLGVGATLTGRALTTSAGAVTMAGTNTVGGCSAPGGGCPTITLSPPTLPNGTVGVAYSQTIVGNGGAAPSSFGVTAGTLPAGVTLTTAGLLSGTPTTAGSSTFTIRGTDANGCFAELSYTIVIAAAPPPPPVCPTITLSPPTLPNGTVGVAYSQTIVGNGGNAPYSFGVTAGALPAGVTLTAAGLLAGTPTTAGSSTFTIRGTDVDACFGQLSYTIVIAAAPPPPPVCPTITLSPADVAQRHSGDRLHPDDRGERRECAVQLWRDGRRPAGRCNAYRGRLAGGNADDGRQLDVHGTRDRRRRVLRYPLLYDRHRRRSAAAAGLSHDYAVAADAAQRHSGDRVQPDDRGKRRDRAVQLWRDSRCTAGGCDAHRGRPIGRNANDGR